MINNLNTYQSFPPRLFTDKNQFKPSNRHSIVIFRSPTHTHLALPWQANSSKVSSTTGWVTACLGMSVCEHSTQQRQKHFKPKGEGGASYTTVVATSRLCQHSYRGNSRSILYDSWLALSVQGWHVCISRVAFGRHGVWWHLTSGGKGKMFPNCLWGKLIGGRHERLEWVLETCWPLSALLRDSRWAASVTGGVD